MAAVARHSELASAEYPQGGPESAVIISKLPFCCRERSDCFPLAMTIHRINPRFLVSAVIHPWYQTRA